ncbi:MAG: hypothetical protein V4787_12390 [Pseudomonadota bacterium]
MQITLRHVAHVRTGDKGNTSNIAVIAYHAQLYPILQAQLTADRLFEHYQGMIEGEVRRFEVPGIGALNFVAQKALGGGVSRSMRLDPYGKSLSAALLGFVFDLPDSLAPFLVGHDPSAPARTLRRADLMIPSLTVTRGMQGNQ